MPSAAKPVLDTPVMASECTDPIRQIMKTVEHKIRNLDKRKSKLEGYQDLRISGKNLTADQEVAISKYEEVVQCLLCAQDLLKGIQGIAVTWDKEQKNVQRKETAARVANEVFKVKETFILQDILRKFRSPEVRLDFESGNNGAVKLEADDLVLLDKLIAEGFVSLDEADSKDAFEGHAHRAADHWVSTVDGKPKQFMAGIAYERVRRVVRSIQDSGYFYRRFASTDDVTTQEDQEATTNGNGHGQDEQEEEAGEEEEEQFEEGIPEAESNTETPSLDTMSVLSSSDATGTQPTLLPPSAPTPNDSQINPIPVLQQQQQQINNQQQPAPHHHLHHQQPIPQPCPIPVLDPNTLPVELETGAFSFLQDSELDEQLGMDVVQQNGHPTPLPQQQHHQQPIPTQPPGNMLLINPMLSLAGIPQAHVVDQMVNGAGIPNGIGGGVTPPMFSFPYQTQGVANMQLPNPNGVTMGAPQQPQQQQQMLNPVQQLVKTLNGANFHHHQLPAAAPLMMPQPQQQPQQPQHNMNGNQNVAPALPTVQGNGMQGYAAPNPVTTNNGTTETVEEKATIVVERTSPVMPNTEQMTISEWDPVGQKDGSGHEKRETSTESSSAGDRRRDDNRRPGRHDNGGGGGGYNGPRRRYGPSNAATGAANNNYNGSRMHRNGGGTGNGPVDGENGGGSSSSSSFRGQGAKPHHYNNNRMSNGAGGAGGSGGSGGSNGSTFYRNNDPNYYTQNGMKSASVRHSQQGHQGFNQQRPTTAGTNRN